MLKKLVEEFEATERQLHEEIECDQNLDKIKHLDQKIQKIYAAICAAPVPSNHDKMTLISFHLDRLCAANDQIAHSENVGEIRRIVNSTTPVEGLGVADWGLEFPHSKVSNIA